MASPVYHEEEIHEMFNTSFLPKLQEFAKRVVDKRKESGEEDIKFWECQLKMQFDELENTLTYEMVKDRLDLKLCPVTQSDIDRFVKEQEVKLNGINHEADLPKD